MKTSTLSSTQAYDVETNTFHTLFADARWYGVQAVCGSTAKGFPVTNTTEGARLEREGATHCYECRLFTDRRSLWTIAFRKRTANRFQRVTNWSGNWADAVRMAGVYGAAHPELEIYYVLTLDAERARPESEDNGNVLVESGKRIRIVDNAELPDSIIAEFIRVSGYTVHLGRTGHYYMSIPGTDNHIICLNASHVTNGSAYACAHDAIWAEGAHRRTQIEALDAIDHGHAVEVMTQVVDNGREDLLPVLDMIDAASFQSPDVKSSIPCVPGCEKCEGDANRCDACMLAWLVDLFKITGDVKLNELPAVAEFDCYA